MPEAATETGTAPGPADVEDLDVEPGGSRRPLIALGTVAALVVVAHAPYLIGLLDPNPLLTFSSLEVALRNGPLAGRDTIDPNAGYTAQALGHRVALEWLHGHVPWWNPYEGAGGPMAAEMNSAAFLPLSLLLVFAGGQVWFYLVLDLISAFASFALLRRLRVNRWVAVACGVAFGLNGSVAWFRYSAANPVAFLPLLLLGVEQARAATEGRRRGGWLLVAVALTLSLYAGFPETAYLDGLLVVVWVVGRLGGLGRDAVRRFLGKLASGVAAGVLVAAPILVAFVGYLPQAYVGAHSGALARAALPRSSLGPLVFPYLFGPIFGFIGLPQAGGEYLDFWGQVGGYLTASLVVLALVGITGVRGRPLAALRGVLSLWVVLVLLRIYGVGVVIDLVNLVPGLKSVAFMRYSWPSLEMAVVVLAALGADDLVRRRLPRLQAAVVVAAAAALMALAAAQGLGVVRSLAGAPHRLAWADASLLWGAAMLVAVGGVVLLDRRRLTVALLATVVTVDAVAMFMVPEFSSPRGANLDMPVVSFLQSHLGTYRFYTLGPLQPDYGAYFGIASLNANDLPVPKGFDRLVQTRLDSNATGGLFTGANPARPGPPSPAEAFAADVGDYESLGVRYLVMSTPVPDPVPADGSVLRSVYRDPWVKILELPDPRPFFSSTGAGCRVSFTTRDRAEVDCPEPALLRRNELVLRGWNATVNGSTETVGADGLGLQTVAVPAGRSTVRFSYLPPHMAAAVLALVVGLILGLWPYRPASMGRRLPAHGRGSGRRGRVASGGDVV